MSLLLQWLIVAPLVLAAVLSAVWRLLTSRLRLRVLSGLLRCLPQKTDGPLASLRSALARRVAAESPGGCAACSKH
ncbi:MAG: hypothetical protein ABI645_11625 [Pseudomonadota bacterium]